MALSGINKMRVIIMVLVAMLSGKATAQSSCTSVLIGMAPCLNYVTGSSSTPSSSCCSQLATVVRSQPQCLCAVLNGGAASLGVTINQTLALALPGVCKVQTPPVSRCNATNGSPVSPPDGSPASSPEGLPGDSPNNPSSSATGGSKTVPGTGGNSANCIQMRMSFQIIFFVLFMALCASTSSSSF